MDDLRPRALSRSTILQPLVIGGMEYFSGGLLRPGRPFVAGIA
jgi:hypothetical protein